MNRTPWVVTGFAWAPRDSCSLWVSCSRSTQAPRTRAWSPRESSSRGSPRPRGTPPTSARRATRQQDLARLRELALEGARVGPGSPRRHGDDLPARARGRGPANAGLGCRGSRVSRPRRSRGLSVSSASDTIADDMRPVREAVYTGDIDRSGTPSPSTTPRAASRSCSTIRAARQRGIAPRAQPPHSAASRSSLEAQGRAGTEPCTVLVAPGSIVKAASGFQDTAPIQARFLDVTPAGRTEQPATICCAAIHSNDPRSTSPRGITRHDVRASAASPPPPSA